MKVTAAIWTGLIMLLWIPYVSAMSAPAHIAGMSQVEGVSSDVAGSVTRWMDNPATKTGQYLNHKAGGVPVSPANHNALRHNPEMVARALSGNGTVDSVKLAAARMHKLQDIAYNVRPIDGWPPTMTMKNEAKALIRAVERFGRFPKRLPAWLDQSGPLLTGQTIISAGKTGSVAVGSSVGRIAVRSGVKQIGKAIGRSVGIVVVIVSVGTGIVELYDNEKRFENGDISEEELEIANYEAICGNATGAVAGAAGVVGGAALGTAVMPGLGTIGGSVTGAIACGSGGEYVGRRVGRMIGKAVYGRAMAAKAYTRETNARLFKYTEIKGYYIEKED